MKFSEESKVHLDERFLEGENASLMSGVYAWMSLALLVSGATAFLVAKRTDFFSLMLENPFWYVSICIAELALVVALSRFLGSLGFFTAAMMFLVYSIVNGFTLSIYMLSYSVQDLARAFLVTSLLFVSMSLYGFFTKRDLSRLGSLLYVGLWGLIIATVVNIFIGSATFGYVISYVGVVLFLCLTAYDTKSIKLMLMESEGDVTLRKKVSLLGALSLYLDFVNLFIYLLKIFSKRS